MIAIQINNNNWDHRAGQNVALTIWLLNCTRGNRKRSFTFSAPISHIGVQDLINIGLNSDQPCEVWKSTILPWNGVA